MANALNLVSYELNGVKESFANWISNLSPVDTPFVSMTGKESIKNKYFQWQEDKLAAYGLNAVAEGSDAVAGTLGATALRSNVTQILRKVVQVSDTANALSNHGRGKEMQYQLEKAGKEIKRDLEFAFLNQKAAVEGSSSQLARQTAGFEGLVAQLGVNSPEDSSAVVHQAGDLTEENLFNLTNALYLAGACPDIIMFHPKHAKFFSGLMEDANGSRVRMFDGASDTKLNKYVSTLVDPLGCTFKLIPNRFMPEDRVFFFRAADWTQMVLRAPTTQLLAKTGSFDKYMIEMEVGLRHNNIFNSGILELPSTVAANIFTGTGVTQKGTTVTIKAAPNAGDIDVSVSNLTAALTAGTTVPATATADFKDFDTSGFTVTIKAAGKTSGTVIADGVTYTVNVEVAAPAPTATLTVTSPVAANTGDVVTLVASSSDNTSVLTYTIKSGSTNNTAGGSLGTGSNKNKLTVTTAGKTVVTVAGSKGETSKEITVNVTAAPAQTPVSVAASGTSASIYDDSSKTATFTGLSDALVLTPTPASATATLGGADAAKFQWTAGSKTVALKDDSASANATLTFSNSGNADLVVNLVFTKP